MEENNQDIIVEESKEESLEDYRIHFLEKSIKSYKTMATVSGVVASLSALVAVSNLAFGDELQALQQAGVIFAMGTYTYAFPKLNKMIKEEIQFRRESIKETPTPENMFKNLLQEFKLKINQLRLKKNYSICVGSGFISAGIVSIIRLIEEQRVDSVLFSILAGVVGALDIITATQYNKELTNAIYQQGMIEKAHEMYNSSIDDINEPDCLNIIEESTPTLTK